mgnify:CR=1 FL=1
MKITDLHIYEVDASTRGNWLFVVIDTDSGIQGVGEASQSGNDELVRVCLRQLAERIEGADPTQPEVAWELTAGGSDVFSGKSGRVGATAMRPNAISVTISPKDLWPAQGAPTPARMPAR